MRLALGVSLVEKGDLPAGESHLAALAQDVKSAQSPAARRWLGEVYFRQKDWSRAVAQLLAFRQEQALRTIPDVSDQAMLRLGQAYGNLGDWNASRSALESGLRRFSEGPVASQMRYAMGTALEKTDQLDAAIAAYDGVIKRGPAGIAAMAQYRIGRCRKSQGRTDEALKQFVAAGFSYEISDSGGKAMVEAAGILFEMKRDDEARRILDRVLKEHPAGEIYERAMKIREGK
jgi:TolA-binding protein